MADTLNNVVLPANTWVDLYSETGITVGVKILLQNLGSTNIRIATKTTAPLAADGFKRVNPNQQATNETGDSGAWAYSPIVDGLVNAGVAV